jgi:hypothetical protein
MGVAEQAESRFAWQSAPSPDEIASHIMRRKYPSRTDAFVYIHEGDPLFAEWSHLRDLASEFTARFDQGLIEDVAAALGVADA